MIVRRHVTSSQKSGLLRDFPVLKRSQGLVNHYDIPRIVDTQCSGGNTQVFFWCWSTAVDFFVCCPKVFALCALLLLPFGRKRVNCDHHMPSMWRSILDSTGDWWRLMETDDTKGAIKDPIEQYEKKPGCLGCNYRRWNSTHLCDVMKGL